MKAGKSILSMYSLGECQHVFLQTSNRTIRLFLVEAFFCKHSQSSNTKNRVLPLKIPFFVAIDDVFAAALFAVAGMGERSIISRICD